MLVFKAYDRVSYGLVVGASDAIHVHDVEFGIHAPGHAGASSDEVLPCWVRRDADGHALSHRPIFPDVLGFHVGFEAAVNLLRDLA